jgi:predicted small integral membrane protein
MRLGKIFLVMGIGLFIALAAFNNAIGPNGPYGAVTATVSMADTFNDPNVMWRAIESPLIKWMAVIGIIAAEATAGFFCLFGAYRLWVARSSAESFNAAKSTALIGLTVIAAFYLIGFHAICNEWFMLWQNRESETLQEAFRNFASAMLIMIWLNTDDK